jgi:hypothetical protein
MLSRSWMMNLYGSSPVTHSPNCCSAHPAVGCCVTLKCKIRRLPTSMSPLLRQRNHQRRSLWHNCERKSSIAETDLPAVSGSSAYNASPLEVKFECRSSKEVYWRSVLHPKWDCSQPSRRSTAAHWLEPVDGLAIAISISKIYGSLDDAIE